MNIAILLLSSIGLLDSFFLTKQHYTHDPFSCPLFGGCGDVTSSVYSEFMGVPISLLGLFFYATVFSLSLYSYLRNNNKALVLASQLTLLGFTTSLVLVYIQVYILQSICFYCMLSALTSTLLFAVGLKVLNKQKNYALRPYYSYLSNLKSREIMWAITRISMGWIFLWTFIDKLPIWVSDKSPVQGFLANGTTGVFAEFFENISGSQLVSALYMLGVLLVGIALVLGISTKLAFVGGSLMMLFIYLASALPPAHNPILDEHVVYILVLWGIYINNTGQWLGFHNRWLKTNFVKTFPIFS